MNTSSPTRHVPTILRLSIERFRRFENYVWYPSSHVNVILGGGDVGKSTILDAIGLLFSPTNFSPVSDADYWRRDVEKEFIIEAVMSLPDSCGIHTLSKHAWPWEWDGREPQRPKLEDDGCAEPAQPVYRVRVRGTAEMDLAHELLQPDDTTDHFPVAIRRAIGLLRLSGDDRNDRDLRLVQGSALDRLLSDKTLRARLGHKLTESDVLSQLKDDAKEKLESLDKAFLKQALPNSLGLGFTGSQGLSASALIGLTADEDGVQLPLASWGAGTRRLAALEIAGIHQGEAPITLVDEVERGLEPYRQRQLIASIDAAPSQVFVTTHSAVIVKAASRAELWHLDSRCRIGPLSAHVVRSQQKRDPETFLARFTVVVEGQTELGFIAGLMKRTISPSLYERGVWLTDGEGNPRTLDLLEALAQGGLSFGGFADNEGQSPDRWKALQERLGPLLFRWKTGCIEENILRVVPDDKLEEFIRDPNEDDLTGERLRSLQERLSTPDKKFSTLRDAATDFRATILAAATGRVPDCKKNADRATLKALRAHAENWFKSERGGRELANKLYSLKLAPALEGELLPFLNAICRSVGVDCLQSLRPLKP
jgi:putative ATP-dependent endonuclease of the OLD family